MWLCEKENKKLKKLHGKEKKEKTSESKKS